MCSSDLAEPAEEERRTARSPHEIAHRHHVDVGIQPGKDGKKLSPPPVELHVAETGIGNLDETLSDSGPRKKILAVTQVGQDEIIQMFGRDNHNFHPQPFLA